MKIRAIRASHFPDMGHIGMFVYKTEGISIFLNTFTD